MSTNVSISPEVIIKSRIRLARNIVDYPFSPVLNDACRKEIIEKVENALVKSNFKKLDMAEASLPYTCLFEENKISREFASDNDIRALFYDDQNGIYIMVCEEDHLRLQSFSNCFDLLGAYNRLFEIERTLNSKIKFAFDKNLGYLTHCPTNLGTAMRASVMMFLPALTLTNRMRDIKNQLEKIGVTIRGFYGEGSSAEAFIYQISNSLSLGISEADIISKITAIATSIATDEVSAREAVFSANADKLTDKIMRSVGILNFSHLLSSKEFFECYAYTRLGICLGIVKNTNISEIDKLLFSAMPGHISIQNSLAANNTDLRDKIRAATVKSIFKEV